MILKQIFQGKSANRADEIFTALKTFPYDHGSKYTEPVSVTIEKLSAGLTDRVFESLLKKAEKEKSENSREVMTQKIKIMSKAATALGKLANKENEGFADLVSSTLSFRRHDSDSGVFKLATFAVDLVTEKTNENGRPVMRAQADALGIAARHYDDYSYHLGSGNGGYNGRVKGTDKFVAAAKAHDHFGNTEKADEMISDARRGVARQGHVLEERHTSYIQSRNPAPVTKAYTS